VTGSGYIAMLAQIAAQPVDLDVYRRLHVEVSDIYHAGRITLEEASQLRSVINRAFADRRYRVLTAPDPVEPTYRKEVMTMMSCDNLNCRKGGCSAPADGKP
jgi:hypothetical protein